MTQRQRNWKADVSTIREILNGDWNPIGCGVPEDEYDSYIPDLYRLMQRGVSLEELRGVLDAIESEKMGLQAVPERNRHVAQLLIALMQ